MFGTSSESHPNPLKTHQNRPVAVEQKWRLFRGGGKNHPHTFCWTLCSCSHDCQIALPYRKGEEGENAGLCAVIFKTTHFSLAEETEKEKLAAELCAVIFVGVFFGPVLSSYNFISFNRLAPNLHQHHEKELGLRKQTRQRLNSLWSAFEFSRLCPRSWWLQRDGPCTGLDVHRFAFEYRGGLSMALVTGRNAVSTCTCKRGWFNMLFRDRA